MEWIVKIENQPNQRILVKFDPKNEVLLFIGQYKPHNKEWVDFSAELHSMKIDLEMIQDLLYKTYKKMKERLDAYENIAEGFSVIKLIEIKEEE
jgi:hypothetical protein